MQNKVFGYAALGAGALAILLTANGMQGKKPNIEPKSTLGQNHFLSNFSIRPGKLPLNRATNGQGRQPIPDITAIPEQPCIVPNNSLYSKKMRLERIIADRSKSLYLRSLEEPVCKKSPKLVEYIRRLTPSHMTDTMRKAWSKNAKAFIKK